MVHKWAASQRQRIGKLIRTKGMSAEQKARIKAKQAVEDAKWKLEREFGRHRNRADVARYGYTYRRPEPPRSPVLLAKREVDMEYLSYCRNRAEEWYRTKPIRQALGQLVGRLYAGEFGVLKGWALPVAFYRAADAALGRRAVRESELPARYGSRVERRNSYLRGFWNWGANLPGKPAATLEPASFDREAAELFLKKRREWAERAAWYDALVLELQIAEEQLALLQNQGR